MRSLLALALLAPCAREPEDPPLPWRRGTLLAEGSEHVVVERRDVPAFPDGQTEFRIFFSHDRGRNTRPVTEGSLEHFDRRVRALRLPDGRLAVAAFTTACVETPRAAIVCHDLSADTPPHAALRPFVAWLSHDEGLEDYVRERAARSLTPPSR